MDAKKKVRTPKFLLADAIESIADEKAIREELGMHIPQLEVERLEEALTMSDEDLESLMDEYGYFDKDVHPNN